MGKKSFARKIKKAYPSPTGKEIVLSPGLPKSRFPRKRKNETSPHRDSATKKHKSSKYIVKCRPVGLCQMIEALTDEQRSAVQAIGFGGLLSMHDLRYIPWGSMSWFFENFNAKSRVLTFSNNKTIVVTPDDIRDLFLIPRNEGNDVLLNDDHFAALNEFKSRYEITTKELTQSTVVNLLKGSRLRDGGDDFKRFFILYSMSTFLASTMNQTIDTSIFRSLVDIDQISEFDWCKFVVERLCKGLRGLKKNLNGCVLVLPLLYFHRFMWLGVAESQSLPLIKHWTCTKIKSRLRDELIAGEFGHGSWVEGVYPVSRNHNPTIPTHVPNDSEDEEIKDVHGTDSGEKTNEEQAFITYKLPTGEKTDEEIKRLAKDGLQESFLLLQRDLNVITQIHLKRLKQIRKKDERQQATSSSLPSSPPVADDSGDFDELFCDPEFHKHIDDLVNQFTNLKKTPKQTDDVQNKASQDDSPNFNLLTPTPERIPTGTNENEQENAKGKDVVQELEASENEQENAKGKDDVQNKASLDDSPNFNLLTPTPERTPVGNNENEQENTKGKDVVQDLEASEVTSVERYYTELVVRELSKSEDIKGLEIVDPWYSFVGDDDWMVYTTKPKYASQFLKKYEKSLTGFTQKEKDIVDYFFRRISPASDWDPVFSHHNQFFIHFNDVASMNQNSLIHLTIIDQWSMLLNTAQKFELKSNGRMIQKLYFSGQHSCYLDSVSKSKDEKKREEFVENLKGCWRYWLSRMGEESVIYTANLIFFPICYEHHFFAAVVDFNRRKIHYLNNIKFDRSEDPYVHMVVQLKAQFQSYLELITHPKVGEFKDYPIESVAFQWQSNISNVDCGVFLLNHMENFEGTAYECKDLTQLQTRRVLRAKYCTRIILSEMNHVRHITLSKVKEFISSRK